MDVRRVITIDGARIVADDIGPADGSGRMPLVLLHGAVQSRSVWRSQVPVFARTRRVVVMDLRGHGETQGDVAALSIESFAGDLLTVLDRLEIPQAVLCGVSLGGMVALEAARMAPERVGSLILADTPLALSLDGPVRGIVESLGPQRLLWPLFRLIGQRNTARLGLAIARAFCGRGWVGREAGKLFVEGFSAMTPEAVVATYAAIVAADPVAIAPVNRRCLVIVGRHETRLVVAHAGEIARRLGRAEIVAVEGGHVPNVDAPNSFNAAVQRFLDDFDDAVLRSSRT